MVEKSQERDVLELVNVSADSGVEKREDTAGALGEESGAGGADSSPADASKGDTRSATESASPGAAAITAPADLSDEEFERLRTDIVAALKTVYDPEIPSDIYELGLIYRVDIGDDRDIDVEMTLTAPGCPVAGEMPIWVENAVASVAGQERPHWPASHCARAERSQ